ncbi:hypothetical protein A5757_02360 [Mycobacterium sp. 852013-51886_SCH5428379]|uniref:hypothetical protein n=1 Tax=Mycobacterium sp. 852013-51886_SCH5428379 TaxID=1834111 RepID=UPI0007FD378B|nr:hypothetical protein [Mycobacterium sp. 852013-51886_SCH5428379]OBB55913.1 hypothetical protein A5757_02360 [Mycobacterium sp. 852013-51886_SCH5428379]
MKSSSIAATTIVAGAIGAAALGVGVGTAQADPWLPPPPPIPGFVGPGPGVLPPPGHLNKIFGPPGHWHIHGVKINPGHVNHR